LNAGIACGGKAALGAGIGIGAAGGIGNAWPPTSSPPLGDGTPSIVRLEDGSAASAACAASHELADAVGGGAGGVSDGAGGGVGGGATGGAGATAEPSGLGTPRTVRLDDRTAAPGIAGAGVGA
jgi:hypothetical protein